MALFHEKIYKEYNELWGVPGDSDLRMLHELDREGATERVVVEVCRGMCV